MTMVTLVKALPGASSYCRILVLSQDLLNQTLYFKNTQSSTGVVFLSYKKIREEKRKKERDRNQGPNSKIKQDLFFSGKCTYEPSGPPRLTHLGASVLRLKKSIACSC